MASCTQIDHQIQSYLDGELAHSDRAILEHHIAECTGCAAVLRKHQRSHASLFEVYAPQRLKRELVDYVVSHLPEMEPLPLDVARVNLRAKHPSPMRERLFRLMPIAAAALLVVLAGVINTQWPDPSAPTNTIGVVGATEGSVYRVVGATQSRSKAGERTFAQPGDRFETGPDSMAAMLMLGPSELRLAADTAVLIENDRRITLERGRIFLDVASSQRLFTVFTPMGEVTVFGTRFDVQADALRTTVMVEDGEVQLTHRENPRVFRIIQPDQRAYVEHGLDMVPVETVDVKTECAWETALSASAEVREYFTKRIQPGHETDEVSGEGGFLLTTNGQPLHSLVLRWKETSPFVRYSDYAVFVYAPDNESVFRAHLDGKTFTDPLKRQIEIPNTGDDRNGYPTVFVKVVALGGTELGRVSFESIVGQIIKEGK